MILPHITSDMMYKVHRVLYKSDELQEHEEASTCSQAINALMEGSTTTGGVGSLNNQHERPTSEMMMT